MQSEFGKNMVEMLETLKESLSTWEDAYNEHLDNRISDSTSYPEVAPLSKISDEAAEVHVAQYSTLEDLISLYEEAINDMQTEVIDGRTMDDLYADMEDRFEKIDRLGSAFGAAAVALDDYKVKMDEEVAKLDNEILVKAVLENSVHKSLDSSIGKP